MQYIVAYTCTANLQFNCIKSTRHSLENFYPAHEAHAGGNTQVLYYNTCIYDHDPTLQPYRY